MNILYEQRDLHLLGVGRSVSSKEKEEYEVMTKEVERNISNLIIVSNYLISRVRIVIKILRLNKRGIQWNLSIADMLYSGNLPIADTFPDNG